MTETSTRIGLGLSGGGYRASAFHLGTLKKLKDLGILNKIDVMSCISGGAITGAAWGVYDGDYDKFHAEMIEKLRTKSVIRYIFKSLTFLIFLLFALLFLGGSIYLTFTCWAPFSFLLFALFVFLLFRFQFKIFPVSRVIEKAYDDFFYNKGNLENLRKDVLIGISSSNLHTGRPFTFSYKKMGDSAYGDVFRHEKFPIARAVVASSCVPFAFTPVTIHKDFIKDSADLDTIKPVLVDGGVYDNQGLHKLTQHNNLYECGIIIVSDAGGSFMADMPYPNTISLLVRTVDLFMYRIKASQMIQNIYKNVNGSEKPIAYFSLGWEIENLIKGFVENMIDKQILNRVIDAHGFEEAWKKDPKNHKNEITEHLKKNVGYEAVEKRNLQKDEWEIARRVGTNLTRLSEKQIDYLIRHAENLTEIQVKLYCPFLIESHV